MSRRERQLRDGAEFLKIKHCRGAAPGCGGARLINAHIIPRSFARMLKDGSNKHNLELSIVQVKATQLGIFDKNISCAKCDVILGKLDDYLYDVIRYTPYPSASGGTKCCSRGGSFVLEQITNITALGDRDDRLSSLVDRVPAAFRR